MLPAGSHGQWARRARAGRVGNVCGRVQVLVLLCYQQTIEAQVVAGDVDVYAPQLCGDMEAMELCLRPDVGDVVVRKPQTKLPQVQGLQDVAKVRDLSGGVPSLGRHPAQGL